MTLMDLSLHIEALLTCVTTFQMHDLLKNPVDTILHCRIPLGSDMVGIRELFSSQPSFLTTLKSYQDSVQLGHWSRTAYLPLHREINPEVT